MSPPPLPPEELFPFPAPGPVGIISSELDVSFKGSDFISKLGSVLNSLSSVLNSKGVDEAEVDAEAVIVVVVVENGS